MDELIEAVIELVANTPPDKSRQLAGAVRKLSSAKEGDALSNWANHPSAQARLAKLVQAWRRASIPPDELAGMLAGATSAYHHAKAEQEIELVWTGPSSKLVATRKTEQALLQVIDAAMNRLFMTSFVAYDVASVMKALERATGRGVKVSMLLEASDKQGGNLSFDALGKMKAALPNAHIF
jgi:phosphatidylserine/phosphatidylglycerophosphate/cardiolipin synthase-like enzyme